MSDLAGSVPAGPPSPAIATAALRDALERSASALATARLDDLLAAGEALEMALSHIPRAAHSAGNDPERLRAEIDAARAALLRCRRLGISLGDFVRASFDAYGQATGYEPTAEAARALNGRGLNTSV